MRQQIVRLAQTEPAAPSSGPKWIPIRQDWPWIAGTLTVAALVAGLTLLGLKK